mmetsp:Transcript_39630/g.61920  ORF Transcript_39630/g.61920 Transcript_39630/m.61920 type:complete len:208 (-) Transcript_39630:242-865(-)
MVSTHIIRFRKDRQFRQKPRRYSVTSATDNNEKEEDSEKADERGNSNTMVSKPSTNYCHTRAPVHTIHQQQKPELCLQSNQMALHSEDHIGNRPENSPTSERANVIFSANRRSIFATKDPKVSFSDSVKVKFIPFYYEYGEDQRDEIWWNQSDYLAFQEVAIRFVRMYGSLKNIKDEDHAHDEPMLILNHRGQTPSVPKSQYCSAQA